MIDTAFVEVRPLLTGFGATVATETKGQLVGTEAAIAKSGRTSGALFGGSFAKGLKGFAGITVAALGVEKLASTVRGAVQISGQLQKSTEAIGLEFGKSAGQVTKFASEAAKIGIGPVFSQDLSVRIGILAHNLGISQAKAADMTTGLQALGGSIAEIRGKKPEELLGNLPQVLAGNLRSLKQLGFAFSNAQIKQEAVTEGLIKQTGALTPAAKAQAIYGLLIRQLGHFQDEAAKHSGDLVSQQHQLSAEWEKAKGELGKGLLPALTSLTTSLARDLPGAVKDTTAAFKGIRTVLDPVVSLFGGYKGVIEGIIILKLASTVRGWAAAHLLEAGAVTSNTGALALNTTAVVENQVAVERSVVIYGQYGEVLSTVVVAEAGAGAGSLGIASKVEGIGAGALVAGSRIKTLRTALLGIGSKLFVASLELQFVSAITGGRIDPIKWAFDAGASAGQAFHDSFEKSIRTIGNIFGSGGAARTQQEKNLRQAQADLASRDKSVQRLLDAGKRKPPSKDPSVFGSPHTFGKSFPAADRKSLIDDTLSRALTNDARKTTRATQDAIIKAENDVIAFDQKYESIQESLIRRHIGDAKQHFKIIAGLRSEEQGALGQINSINTGRASDAKAAASKARREAKARAATARRRRNEASADVREAAREAAKDVREQRALLDASITLAQGTPNTLVDDIRAEKKLIAFLAARAGIAKRMFVLQGKNAGLVRKGNIDLLHRPDVKNPDGSHSSVRSASFGIGGLEVLIPTVIPDGKGGWHVVSDKQALAYYEKTGQNLGKFKTVAAANDYANRLHLEQAALGRAQNRVQKALTAPERSKARSDLREAESKLKNLLKDQAKIASDNREQSLQDDLTIAGFSLGKADDKRALTALEKFYKGKKDAAAKGSVARKEWLIKLLQTEKDLKNVSDAEKRVFQQQAFAFLQTQQGFAANLTSNLLGSTGGLVGGTTSAGIGSTPPTRPLPGSSADRPLPVPGALQAEAARQQGGKAPQATQLEVLIHLARQQLTQLQLLRGANAHPEARTSRVLSHTGTEVGAA